MKPKNWSEKPLKDCVEKIIDYRGQSVPKSNDGIPLITAKNVRKGHLSFDDQEYVDADQYESWMTRGFPQEGDVLFTTEAPLGYSAMFPIDRKYAVGQRTVTIRPKTGELDGKYLMYFFLGLGKSRIYSRATGSTALGIKSSELKKLPILYPPYEEQVKIRQVIESWDERIEYLNRLVSLKEKRLRGYIQEMSQVGGKEYFLRDIGEFSKGKGISKSETTEEGVPCVRYGELYTLHHAVIKDFYSYIPEDIRTSTQLIKKHDILFAGSGETVEEIGKSAVNLSSAEAYAGGDIIIMSPNTEVVDSIYLSFLLNSGETRRQLIRLGQGSSVIHIYTKDIKELRVNLPPLGVQEKWSNLILSLNKEVDFLKEKKLFLKKQKKGLMQQLLTGKKRVNTK